MIQLVGWIHVYLEPQTTIYKWMVQLDDSKSLHKKWLFHQTSIYKWLFGVPGTNILNDRLQGLGIEFSQVEGFDSMVFETDVCDVQMPSWKRMRMHTNVGNASMNLNHFLLPGLKVMMSRTQVMVWVGSSKDLQRFT